MMEIDELSYNVFYLLLRNEYRKKYDHALTKCWTICVPCGDSLRDVSVTKELIDDHILKLLPEKIYASTDENESHYYKIDKNVIKLINNDESKENYRVKILSTEKGYNKEFQPYNIIIIDKPIHRKYRISAQKLETDKLQLNRTVTSYKDAVDFLKHLPNDKSCNLEDLETEIENIDIVDYSSIDDIKEKLQNLIRDYWASTMRKQSLDVQRDGRFQKLLSISLEMLVMRRIHDTLYSVLSNLFVEQDSIIKKKIDELIAIDISPDQLGVKESVIVPMPSAMVELATLGSQMGPHDKLMCLKGTLEFIVAEVKGAIADIESRTDFLNDNSNEKHKSFIPDTNELILLLVYVIIKCHCHKLITDLYYMENFIWCIDPHDSLSYTLVTFKAALRLLAKIKVNDLPEKNSNVETKLKLDLLRKDDVKDEPLHTLTNILEEGWPQLVF